jgi:hypothetical protein
VRGAFSIRVCTTSGADGAATATGVAAWRDPNQMPPRAAATTIVATGVSLRSR